MKTAKAKLIWTISITTVIYAALSFWLVRQSYSDNAGWGALGILAFCLTTIFPVYAVAMGVFGQLLLKKLWITPLINAAGVTLFVASMLIFVKDVRLFVLIIIPAVFMITFAAAFITKLLTKAFKKSV